MATEMGQRFQAGMDSLKKWYLSLELSEDEACILP